MSKAAVGNQIFKSLLTSFFISLIGFIAVFSFITGEFPPKISSITRGLENLKKLSTISKTLLSNEHATQNLLARMEKQAQVTKPVSQYGHSLPAEVIANDDLLISELDRINTRRNALGKKLLGLDTHGIAKAKKHQKANASEGKMTPQWSAGEVEEYIHLSQTQFEVLYFEAKAMRSEITLLKQLISNKNSKRK